MIVGLRGLSPISALAISFFETLGPTLGYAITDEAKYGQVPNHHKNEPNATTRCNLEWSVEESKSEDPYEIDDALFRHRRSALLLAK